MSEMMPPGGRCRARALGIAPGVYAPGPLNAITDVAGVRIGHVTLREGERIRTGVTAILPHGGNLFQDKVPAGLAVLNGYGKLMGATQIVELGEIETPIVLTNTLAVGRAAEGVVRWTLAQPGNETVVSLNAVVGETNDGRLNDIRNPAVTPETVVAAITAAREGGAEEGAVGAGTGTVAFGYKGGIGTSSRRLPPDKGGYTLGVLVQTNYGGDLRIDGLPVPPLGRTRAADPDGSIMIVVATDAPLSDRNLRRLAERAFGGLARTGSALSNGSGDYAIAFSTAESVRRTPARRRAASDMADLPNERVSPLFQAAIEATEEAIYNSLFMAETTDGFDAARNRPSRVEAVSLGAVRDLVARRAKAMKEEP
ncbi:P1 family peptidase [Chelatococcus sp. SYSU_G07232]|uniref:P1 family peptidase n=1 Tax=Chelatococcus albus TaxID=3047466 RepID=A0ABT7ALK9_9HYPH|nr:P1 family peptidase [Chelatococcus sp. SYSU_G07232]MDJ1160238.1 P1 family peptidase [Chelatococcus sp. SYSU_G07232]